jgi:NADH-quinone oxidoreductase subunit H
MSILFSLCVILIGIFSRNKYSVLSGVRACCLVLNLEIFLGFFFLFVICYSESFSFSSIINLQSFNFYFFLTILPLLPLFIIVFLLETNRAPFDVVEAESELIAGYTTELGGFFFALFYLGEYFHLFFFSLTSACIMFGG